MLDALCDKRELDELIFKYALALDRRDWDRYRGLLSDDVTFDFSDHALAKTSVQKIVKGADAVLAAAANAMEGFDATQHCISNVIHDIAGDSAKTHCYLTAEHFLNNDRGDRNVACGARYEIEARRSSGGWKIARLRFMTLWFRGNTALYAMAAEKAVENQGGN